MAGAGFILSAQTRTQSLLFSIPKLPSSLRNLPFISRQIHCSCTQVNAVDLTKYKEAFSRRMKMAGLKPHHRIAIGVSGGPDSMALCALTALWKGHDGKFDDCEGFVDGVLAVIVDHRLRQESAEEAGVVSDRVAKMGIRSEVVCCDWSGAKPKQGHVQEDARDMRYRIFQSVCVKNRIGVLLTAHHADDQAELFIIRLSRNSGILGLACMPFTSQIFSTHTHSHTEVSRNHGILLVRPLLDFSKEDMYKICQGSDQEWVEDPTNQSPLYARNRIRMSLIRDASCAFKTELQAVISTCRETRVYIDYVCRDLMSKAVTVSHLGYTIIDLEILNQSKVEEICLSKFISLVLQFISQRHRPLRGNTSRLLVDYMRSLPCKTCLTAAGCFLSPAPGSKGMRALVSCSVDCPLPSNVGLSHQHFHAEHEHCMPDEMEQIITDGKSYADRLVSNASDVPFLEVTCNSVLTEARRLGMISESTHTEILSLQKEEIEHFKSKSEVKVDHKSKHGTKSVSTSPGEPLLHGQICCFMNRFFITWKLGDVSKEALNDESQRGCKSCVVDHDTVLEVRNMREQDWLYLSDLSKSHTCVNLQEQRNSLDMKVDQRKAETDTCLDYARVSAQRALQALKSIPAAARKGLPVLVNSHGLLISIPSIDFQACSCLVVSATFKPKVPLGGDHGTFV